MHHTIAIAMAMAAALLLPTMATAQKKKAQTREDYEFANDVPRYLEQLKQELTYPLAWGNSAITNFDEWRHTARQKVLECMMTPPLRADSFAMSVVAQERREGYTAQRIEFNISAYSRIRAYLLIPDGPGPHPAVNLLHDHGGHLYIGKEKMVRPFAVDSAVVNDADRWARMLYDGRFVGDFLAANGYVVLSIDAPMWGERGRKEGVSRDKYDIVAGNMMMLGRDLCAFMTYDDIATTDFLASLPMVDANRIGCMGCSMGAYRAWMLSALSDHIKAGVAACWMTTTDVQLTLTGRRENGGFANCIPALRQWLDYPHIASMACPKAMLFINGTQDKLFPVNGVNDAFSIMRSVWQSQGASDNLETYLWDVPHSCGLGIQDKALEFFNKHLKK